MSKTFLVSVLTSAVIALVAVAVATLVEPVKKLVFG